MLTSFDEDLRRVNHCIESIAQSLVQAPTHEFFFRRPQGNRTEFATRLFPDRARIQLPFSDCHFNGVEVKISPTMCHSAQGVHGATSSSKQTLHFPKLTAGFGLPSLWKNWIFLKLVPAYECEMAIQRHGPTCDGRNNHWKKSGFSGGITTSSGLYMFNEHTWHVQMANFSQEVDVSGIINLRI